MSFAFFMAAMLQAAPGAAIVYEPEVSDAVERLIAGREQIGDERLTSELELLAEQGDDSALELLGEMYLLGVFDIRRDRKRGCDYFERVGARRPDSLHNLATCYFSGDGRAQDYAKARALYRAAADGGWVTAHCAYGNMLIRGQGGPVEVERGLAMCRHAAQLGDADAQTDLGGYLLVGEVTPRDPGTAREYLLRAARQDHANASFLLGQVYAKGDGVERNAHKSREWFERAFAAGRADAAYQLMQSFLRSSARERDGTTMLDKAFLPHVAKWAQAAKETDPDPARRQSAADVLDELRGSAAQ